jgi:hypothetical protein
MQESQLLNDERHWIDRHQATLRLPLKPPTHDSRPNLAADGAASHLKATDSDLRPLQTLFCSRHFDHKFSVLGTNNKILRLKLRSLG